MSIPKKIWTLSPNTWNEDGVGDPYYHIPDELIERIRSLEFSGRDTLAVDIDDALIIRCDLLEIIEDA